MPRKKVPEAVRLALQKASRPDSPMPHLSELAEHFILEAGGARSVARMLYLEWAQAPAGGVVRARILDLIARVWRFASEHHGRPEELGLLTDEDLERALDERLRAVEPPHDPQEDPAPAGAAPGDAAAGAAPPVGDGDGAGPIP